MMRLMKDDLIVLGILGGVVAGAMALVYVPQSVRLNRLRTRVEEKTRELEDLSAQAAVVPGLFQHVQDLKDRYRNFDRRLPKSQELGGFLGEITAHLADEKFADQAIEPGTPTREKLFHAFPIILRFKGSYPSLALLLQRISEMERLTCVQKLLMNAARDEDGILDIEMQLNIYFTES